MELGTLLVLIVVLVCFGILIWAADRYLSIAQPFKGLIIFLIVVVGVIFILNALGVFGGHGALHVR